jgi:hypothetical protein
MKYRHFISMDQGILPQADFEAICSLDVAGRTPRGFRLTVDSDQPDGGEIVRRFVSICEARGLRRKNVSTATSYGHTADRWHGDDLFRSEILILTRQVITRAGVKDGKLLLGADPVWRMASGLHFSRSVVVSELVRQILDSHKFVGLRFGDTPLRAESADVAQGFFWELAASIVLPKMVNTHQFVHPGRTEAEPFRGDYSKIILIKDPPFNVGEAHYRRSDLAGLGTFDIANTYENLMEPHPSLVISQRFFQCCLANEIGLVAYPVRIDPDCPAEGRVQQFASPNGGPATLPGNSGASEGPPSVS